MSKLEGKTFVVTGANTGIGLVTARTLAERGAHVIMACRSESKTAPLIADIQAKTGNPQVEFLPLDLSSLASVRESAGKLRARGNAIDCLINNAGLAGSRGTTTDGFELTFGVNHLGPYLFTRLLLDQLIAAGNARIVNVASTAHYKAKGIDWDVTRGKTRTRTGLREYEVSKLCNVLFTVELAQRLATKGVTTYSLHPGVVASDVWRQVPAPVRWLMKRFMISVEEGAQTQLYCATAPELASETGLYYDKSAHKTPSAVAQDRVLAQLLWERSAEMVGLAS